MLANSHKPIAAKKRIFYQHLARDDLDQQQFHRSKEYRYQIHWSKPKQGWHSLLLFYCFQKQQFDLC